MWGYSPARLFATACASAITPTTVKQLRLRWFFNTRDVVTATPAVVDGTLYVGDWSGRVYALRSVRREAALDVHREAPTTRLQRPDRRVGRRRRRARGPHRVRRRRARPCTRCAPPTATSCGTTRSATRATPNDPTRDRVVARRRRRQGHLRLGRPQLGQRLPGRAHRARRPHRSRALEARHRAVVRRRRRDIRCPTGAGCGDVWGSPAVDRTLGLVIAGTGNCTQASQLGPLQRRDVRGRPARPARCAGPTSRTRRTATTSTSPGAPNLIDNDGRALAGLGNKDGTYYLVDRATGAPVSAVVATTPGPHPAGRQLLDRRVHRARGVQQRDRRRRDRGRSPAVPARHRRRDRDGRVAQPGAERDVRSDGHRRQRRDRRRDRLHAACGRGRHRLGALVAPDEGRRSRAAR